MLKSFEIRNHGLWNEQYFPGCGVSFTRFTDCYTGCGDDAKEAYEDALEGMYQGTIDRAVLDKLPRRPRGINKKQKVPTNWQDEGHIYVSILLEVV